jgi:hypothetical protein
VAVEIGVVTRITIANLLVLLFLATANGRLEAQLHGEPCRREAAGVSRTLTGYCFSFLACDSSRGPSQKGVSGPNFPMPIQVGRVGFSPISRSCRPSTITEDPSSPPDNAAPPNPEPPPLTLKRVFRDLPHDQAALWTSPVRLRSKQLPWVLPLAGTSALLIATDHHSMVREKSNSIAVQRSSWVANYGLATLVAVPALTYLGSEFSGSARSRETGLLSAEAFFNSFFVDEVLKTAFSRERPTGTDGQGRFFRTIGSPSFPSDHAILAWSVASVVAHEYPGPLTTTVVYGLAAAVSITRVSGRSHFPADVVVGSGLGWLIGREMYRRHSRFRDEDALYGGDSTDEYGRPARRGSTYVELDSWIYPALKRLAALGYIPSQIGAMLPWTHQECVRQLDEADYFAQNLPAESDVRRLIRTLRQELESELQYSPQLRVQSVYARYTQVAGEPLRDSYHFGQTFWNDFGRPYDEGASVVAGGTITGVDGRFFFYARGEYQHAPGRAALSPAQQTLINCQLDSNCTLPFISPPAAAPTATTDRFVPLDMYAGAQIGGYALTFGKQSLWLGPGASGPLMLSDNAEPMYMLRFAHTSPFYLPGFLRFLGPMEDEYLVAKLSGHSFPPRPFFNLQKISFHPTKNLEFGFTRSSLWAGVFHPFTLRSLARNLFSLGDTPPGPFNNPNDLGDRKSGFDFSYRLPGVRNWLTIYADAYSDDDPSPLANPRRSAINPGIYLARVPGLSKLDLRLEAISTQVLTSVDQGGEFLYFNFRYHDSNTNKGFIFGNATGRDGRALQGWTTYHFAPGTTLQFSYRQLKIGNAFLPGGGTQTDGISEFQWRLSDRWTINSFVQAERWFIPILRPTAHSDVVGSVEVVLHPGWSAHH